MSKKNWDDDRYKIEELIATISEHENSDWGKFIVKARMDKHPSTVDIRNLSLDKKGKVKKIGKGISLSGKETDELANLLFEKGYGSEERIEKAIKKRKKMYGFKIDDLLEVEFL